MSDALNDVRRSAAFYAGQVTSSRKRLNDAVARHNSERKRLEEALASDMEKAADYQRILELAEAAISEPRKEDS